MKNATPFALDIWQKMSDEALEKLINQLVLCEFGTGRTALRTFAKRIRDLTAARCLDELRGAARSPEWDEHNDALEEAAQAILALFPGAAETNEAEDGG